MSLGLMILAAIPVLARSDMVVLVTDALLMALLVMSLDIVLGYTGLFNLAQVSLWGSGAYAVVLANLWLGLPTWVALGLSPIAGFLTGLIIGLLCSRVGKYLFPILTLLVAEIYHRAFMYWSTDLGAEMGVFVLGEHYDPRLVYYFVLLACLGSYWISRKAMGSPFGLALRAIRENEIRASFVGSDLRMLRSFSMAFSGILAGLAGGLYVVVHGIVDIHLLHWYYSSEAMALNVISGMGTLTGPFIVGFILSMIKLILDVYVGKGYLITIGSMLIATVLLAPTGIYPIVFAKLRGQKR